MYKSYILVLNMNTEHNFSSGFIICVHA